jgi:methionyl-tRNA synthetase
MPKPAFYITTPIYYVNDKPHLGHAYTTIMCDILRRYHALLGHDSYMLTGTDEHGENILRVARQTGRDVRQMVDENAAHFRDLWPQLGIGNNDFIRTTEERHRRVVQAILQKTYDSGDIYMAKYGGNYCVKCERYFTDKDVEAKPGFCPIHETPLEHVEESNYFFRLSKYQDWLREKIESDPEFLAPEQYRSEVLALLREPLEDLCISRPVERMSWGIPIPFDEKFVTYVWYDALVNYVSALDWPDGEKFARYWPVSTHMIAKDILRQHAVYWPCMLKAAGMEPFHRLRVHGWWTFEGKKMSKTRGNVVDPMTEVGRFGLDVFRYFLAHEMTFGTDGDYSAHALARRNNAELADNLGNLLSRVTAMIVKYCAGAMPAAMDPAEADTALVAELDRLAEELPRHLDRAAIHAYLDRVAQVMTLANRYITEQAPWTLVKQGKMERVGTVLAVASRTLVGVAQLLYPVMPGKMADLLAAYGLSKPERFVSDPIRPGTIVVAAQALFPQIELPAVAGEGTGEGATTGGPAQAGSKRKDKGAAKAPAAPAATPDASAASEGSTASTQSTPSTSSTEAVPQKPEITFDDFAKIDLRVAVIVQAERVPKTDKLMRLEVDLGFERRQIVAGIAKAYTPEQLVGRRIVVVANLASRELRGLTSRGMLLAAHSGDDLFLLGTDDSALPGSTVS